MSNLAKLSKIVKKLENIKSLDVWAIHVCQRDVDMAMNLCRGEYQRNLIRGVENLSGSTLVGKAKEYGGRYRESRDNLLLRMTKNGVRWCVAVGHHNRHILVIGLDSIQPEIDLTQLIDSMDLL